MGTERESINRWKYEELARSFTPVSNFFLENYSSLKESEKERGLNSTEAMFIIHIMSYKWGDDKPFPSLQTIAERMGLSRRQVRNVVKNLENSGYLKRHLRSRGRTSEYDVQKLLDKLYELYQSNLNDDGGAK